MNKNSESIFKRFFEEKINCENEKLDYKREFHFSNIKDKLNLVKDIVSFANTEGGYIIFGVDEKTYEWIGLDEYSDDINDIQIREFMKKYIAYDVDFSCGKYFIEEVPFYLISVEKNHFDLIPFIRDGEFDRLLKGAQKTKKDYIFRKNDIYGRIGSSNKPINLDKTFLKTRGVDIYSNLNRHNCPYRKFISRGDELAKIEQTLNNENIRNVQVNGLGGIGKTSLVRYFCERVIKKDIVLKNKYHFLIWITGKLDYFSSNGEIVPLRQTELSFKEVINIFCDILSIDIFDKSNEELSEEILMKLRNYNSIIIFDNMETINNIEILEFIKKIPINCRLIFTTRSNLTTVYERIDLGGFEYKEYLDYCKSLISDFSCKKSNLNFDEDILPFLSDLYGLVYGSPIITNMILYKVSRGNQISVLINELRKMRKNSTYYDKAMYFCFDGVFNGLKVIEKNVLYIMSISDIPEEKFQVSDIKYIIESDDADVSDALSTLFTLSFCSVTGENYYCLPLVKAFVSKKMSKTKNKDLERITNRYYEWIDKKEIMSQYQNDLFIKARASDFEKKNIVIKIKDMIYKYGDDINNIEYIINEFDKMIDSNPTYAYIYFSKAMYSKNVGLNKSEIIKCFENTILYENNYDFYFSEYAFYLSSIKENLLAIEKFKKALEINDSNPSTNHGLAVCYTKFLNGKDEYFTRTDEILKYFEKGYFANSNNRYANSHNAKNAHAHASYLRNIKKYEEAIIICKKGFEYSHDNSPLKALYSNICKQMDSNYVSKSKVNNLKKGLFYNTNDETIRKIVNMIEEE